MNLRLNLPPYSALSRSQKRPALFCVIMLSFRYAKEGERDPCGPGRYGDATRKLF